MGRQMEISLYPLSVTWQEAWDEKVEVELEAKRKTTKQLQKQHLDTDTGLLTVLKRSWQHSSIKTDGSVLVYIYIYIIYICIYITFLGK